MPLPSAAPLLVLGPLLRHVDPVSATVWVETDRPCTVEVLGRTAPTFCVGGHHYALVLVDGLEPGSTTPYEVHLSAGDAARRRAWPEEHSTYPASRIRTPGRPGPFRIAFGSCRYATPATVDVRRGFPPDALDAYALQVAGMPEDAWPDALVLLGDQVYADELTPATRAWMADRRDLSQPPYEQAADFEEYTHLYAESWSDADVRWLLSTVPSSMVFDDHEVIDDWNTSAAWRDEVAPTGWWQRRISGALASYWVYQHLGNLSPQELEGSAAWQEIVRAAEVGFDAWPALHAMAQAADRDPRTSRWSYVRHWGDVRMVMVDSRAGRVLDEQAREMLDEDEFAWVEAAVHRAAEEGVQHVVVGTSLPWLLPHAIDRLERWDATLARRHHGRLLGRLAEKLRQAADLEHWAAFERSSARLGRLLADVCRDPSGPATALVLSGDVHHAYAAELVTPDGLAGRVHQLTVSPLHNQAPHAIEIGFRVGWSRWARRLTEGMCRLARVEPPAIDWHKTAGPFFGNEVGELVLDGRAARFLLWRTGRDDRGEPRLEQALDLALTGAAAPASLAV